MNLVTLSWRNLWRRKRRTLITASSIAFGVLLAVTFTGTGDYGYTNMINASANMGLGHITLEAPSYNLSPSLDKFISHTAEMQQRLREVPGVSDVMVRIMGQAMFASARKSIGGMFLAIDPTNESAQHNLFIRSIVEGELFAAPGDRGIVIGSKMAQKLGLKLGKKLVYTTTDINGEIVSNIARVSGIFKTGVIEVDAAMVLLPIDSVAETINYKKGDATLLAVIIRDQRYTDSVLQSVKQALSGYDVEALSWQQTQPDLSGIIAMDRSSNYVSQILVGLLIAAGILNTMLMSVIERSREFGVMMAVGMSPSVLFRLVITESLWLAILGLVLGILITAPWFYYLYYTGIDFSGALGDDYSAGGVLIDPVMRIRLYRESVIAILGGVFLLTLASGLYPAWRATRVPPVESLKTI